MMECERCGIEKRLQIAEKDILTLQKSQGDHDRRTTQMEIKLDHIKLSLDEVKIKLTELAEKPARRWDLVINTAVIVVVSAVAGAIVSMVIIGK